MIFVTLENVSPHPFQSVGQALNFINNCNPARLKSLNLLEKESRTTSPGPHAPEDLFASITLALKAVLSTAGEEEREAFRLRNFGDRTKQWAVEDIARHLHRDVKRVHRWLDRLNEELRAELILRQLMEAPKRIIED